MLVYELLKDNNTRFWYCFTCILSKTVNYIFKSQVSMKGGASNVSQEYEKETAETREACAKAKEKDEERGEYQDGLQYDDDEYVLKKLREARVQSFKSSNNILQKYKAKGHGSLMTISQDEFLPTVTETHYVICHFFHEEFETCKIMDQHLRKLVTKYMPVRFVRIEAAKAPFFMEKLAIRVLPTVVMFKDGIAIDRQVGFEGLTEGLEFPTELLERRLHAGRVLVSLNDDGEMVSGIAHKDEKIEEEKRLNAIRASLLANEVYDDFDLDTTDEEH